MSGLGLRNKIERCTVLLLKNRVAGMGDGVHRAVDGRSRHHVKRWLVKSLTCFGWMRIIQMKGFR